jgi:hypothetical protein
MPECCYRASRNKMEIPMLLNYNIWEITMTKLFAGLFLGVFMGTLAYELINRNNPDFIENIRKKAAETMDEFSVPPRNLEMD